MTREEIVTRILKNLDELKERPLWLAYIEDAMLKVFSYNDLELFNKELEEHLE